MVESRAAWLLWVELGNTMAVNRLPSLHTHTALEGYRPRAVHAV